MSDNQAGFPPCEIDPIQLKPRRRWPLPTIGAILVVLVVTVTALGAFDDRTPHVIQTEPGTWVSTNLVEIQLLDASATTSAYRPGEWSITINANIRNVSGEQLVAVEGLDVIYTNATGDIVVSKTTASLVREDSFSTPRSRIPPIDTILPVTITLNAKDGMQLDKGISVKVSPIIPGGNPVIDLGVRWKREPNPRQIYVVDFSSVQ